MPKGLSLGTPIQYLQKLRAVWSTRIASSMVVNLARVSTSATQSGATIATGHRQVWGLPHYVTLDRIDRNHPLWTYICTQLNPVLDLLCTTCFHSTSMKYLSLWVGTPVAAVVTALTMRV
jgi:hypothetical protein